VLAVALEVMVVVVENLPGRKQGSARGTATTGATYEVEDDRVFGRKEGSIAYRISVSMSVRLDWRFLF
jgi:hypothetical protein